MTSQIHPPLLKRFGTLEAFERFTVGELKVGRRIEYAVNAYWKLNVENFLECYHCGPVHPELTRLLPTFRQGTSYQGIPGERTAFAADITAFTLSGTGQRLRLPSLGPTDNRLSYGFVLWPNVPVNLWPGYVILPPSSPSAPIRQRSSGPGSSPERPGLPRARRQRHGRYLRRGQPSGSDRLRADSGASPARGGAGTDPAH